MFLGNREQPCTFSGWRCFQFLAMTWEMKLRTISHLAKTEDETHLFCENCGASCCSSWICCTCSLDETWQSSVAEGLFAIFRFRGAFVYFVSTTLWGESIPVDSFFWKGYEPPSSCVSLWRSKHVHGTCLTPFRQLVMSCGDVYHPKNSLSQRGL